MPRSSVLKLSAEWGTSQPGNWSLWYLVLPLAAKEGAKKQGARLPRNRWIGGVDQEQEPSFSGFHRLEKCLHSQFWWSDISSQNWPIPLGFLIAEHLLQCFLHIFFQSDICPGFKVRDKGREIIHLIYSYCLLVGKESDLMDKICIRLL